MRNNLDFMKTLLLFTDKRGPKKELDWIFFDRENGIFTAMDTKMMIIVTPHLQGEAARVYDNLIPHFNSDGRDEYIDKRGIGFKHGGVDKQVSTYPRWDKMIPIGNQIKSHSMWLETIKEGITIDVIENIPMQKALKTIDVYERGTIVHNGNLKPIMYEFDCNMTFGIEIISAKIQAIFMPFSLAKKNW